MGLRTFRAAAVSGSLVLGALASAGCNDKVLQSSANPVDGGKRIGAPITPEQAAKVLAKVGNHTITLGDFVAAIDHMDQFDRIRYQAPERRRELLNELITMQLLADEAQAKGYDKDPHVQQEIRAVLRDAMLAEAHKGAPGAAEIPVSEVRAYYDANRAAFRDPERRRVSVIVLRDQATADKVLVEARKATTAAEWGEIVHAKSSDPAAKGNIPVDLVGDYGIVSAPGEATNEPNTKVPTEVRDALFKLAKIGDVYEKTVRASDGRIFVLRMTQRTYPHERSFAESDRSIRTRLVQEKVREQEQAYLARLKADYPVQIDDGVMAQVRVDLPPADAGHLQPEPAPEHDDDPHTP